MEPLPPPIQAEFGPIVGGYIRRSQRKHVRRLPKWLKDLVSIVGGGITGGSLGVIIIWWALHMDPFNLGPVVSQHYPVIVPKEFRAQPVKASIAHKSHSKQ